MPRWPRGAASFNAVHAERDGRLLARKQRQIRNRVPPASLVRSRKPQDTLHIASRMQNANHL